MLRCLFLLGVWLSAGEILAHDTWVETNTNLIRTGDAITIDLKLGNHGNHHRDFKLASKLKLGDDCQLDVIAPDGTKYDVTDRLVDVGYTPTEGYWTSRFGTQSPGLYLVGHHLDRVVNHGRSVRSVKSGKTCFVVSDKLDNVSQANPGFDRVLGHPLELVPVSNPVTPMGPGEPIKVRLLWRGQPVADQTVSFIPRGVQLSEDFDARYERRTDADGLASYTPDAGQTVLVVAHRNEPNERSETYEATQYSATLTVFVPQLCPCCGE